MLVYSIAPGVKEATGRWVY